MSLRESIALNSKAVDLLQRGGIRQALGRIKASWTSLHDNIPDDLLRPSQPAYDDPKNTESHSIAAQRQCATNSPGCCPTLIQQIATSYQQSSEYAQQSLDDTVVVFSVRVATGDSTTSRDAEGAEVRVSPQNLFSVYKRAFVLDTTTNGCNDQDMPCLEWLQCAVLLPAVLLFNAGLAYHLEALCDGFAANFGLALEHYHLALVTIESCVKTFVYKDQLEVVYIALCNNLGHCYAHQGDLGNAKMCMERMIIMYRELRRHDGLTAEDMRFFNFYSVLGGDGSIRLAPAA